MYLHCNLSFIDFTAPFVVKYEGISGGFLLLCSSCIHSFVLLLRIDAKHQGLKRNSYCCCTCTNVLILLVTSSLKASEKVVCFILAPLLGSFDL